MELQEPAWRKMERAQGPERHKLSATDKDTVRNIFEDPAQRWWFSEEHHNTKAFSKKQRLILAMQLGVSAQALGRYWATLEKKEKGVPTQKRKTPEQLGVLRSI